MLNDRKMGRENAVYIYTGTLCSLKEEGNSTICKTWMDLEDIMLSKISQSRRTNRALAGVAQWVECWPVNQRVSVLIPCQGTCLGCGPGP